MDFKTALRPYAAKRVEEIKKADILVGIPCFNNENTIIHVVQMVSHGIDKYYRDKKAVIMIADGGSTDDTREVIKEFQLKPWQEKLVTIYRGIPGKGSALRAIFETALKLDVSACSVVDSDLRSINSDWIYYMMQPILERDFQFVAPVYSRYKYDGTITNNIVYNLTRALYGKRIRQPIGGDFAFSKDLAKFYIEQPVWNTDVAKYGIDIWMTTNAITQGFRICQANLGVKIHDAKDPADALGPMFMQVIATLFSLLATYEDYWSQVQGSEPVPTFGATSPVEPEAIKVNQLNMIKEYKVAFHQFGVMWEKIFGKICFEALVEAAQMSAEEFWIPLEIWIEILYRMAVTYNSWPINRHRLLSLMTPIFLGRVASFINKTKNMSNAEAEEEVEQNAQAFEDCKDFLLDYWNKKDTLSEQIDQIIKEI